MTKKDMFKKKLRGKGIKIYRNKMTQASFIKKEDYKKIGISLGGNEDFESEVDFSLPTSIRKELEKKYNTDYVVEPRRVSIKWRLNPVYKTWGVSDWGIEVPDQKIEVEIEFEGDEGPESEMEEISLTDIGVEIESKDGGEALLPLSLEGSFSSNRTWSAVFHLAN